MNWLLTGKDHSTNPENISSDASEKYVFLKTIISRINRAARQNRSPKAIAGIIQKLMEAEIIDLEDIE